MPIFNSCPTNATSSEYNEYIARNTLPSVSGFVPRNNFDRMDYAKKTQEIPSFVENNSQRVEEIVRSMVAS